MVFITAITACEAILGETVISCNEEVTVVAWDIFRTDYYSEISQESEGQRGNSVGIRTREEQSGYRGSGCS